MNGRGMSWPDGIVEGGGPGNGGDHGDCGHRVGRGDRGRALVESGGTVGGTPLVGAIHGEKGVENNGNGVDADATARAQALVQAARFRSDASVVAGLADTYKNEVVRAWLFGAAERDPLARNLTAEGLLFTAAYQDTASGIQSRSSEVALVQAHQPPYVLGTIVDAGGPHPVASVGSQLTGVPFGATTIRRRWAVDLSSPILEVVEAAVTDTGGLIVVERGVIPTSDGAPTLHEAIRFYSASRVGLAASVEGGGRPAMGTGILQILVRPWGRQDICTGCDPRGVPVAQPCAHAIQRVRGLRLGTFRRWCFSLSTIVLVGQLNMEVSSLSTAADARTSRYPGCPVQSNAASASTSKVPFHMLRPVGYSYSFRMSDAAVLLWSDTARRAILGGGEHGLSSVLQLGDVSQSRLPRRGVGGAVIGGDKETSGICLPGAPDVLSTGDELAGAGSTAEGTSWDGLLSDDSPVRGGVPRTVEPSLWWSRTPSRHIIANATGASAVVSKDSEVLSASGNCTETAAPVDNHSGRFALGVASSPLLSNGDPARQQGSALAANIQSGLRRIPVGSRSDRPRASAGPKNSSGVGLAAAGWSSAISASDSARGSHELRTADPRPPPAAAAGAQRADVPAWTGAVSSTALRAALLAMTATARERLAGYSHFPPPVERSSAGANDKPDATNAEGSADRDAHSTGAPAQPTKAQTPSAAGGTTDTDSSCKTGGSSRSGSAHGSGGSQSRPAKNSPSRRLPPPSPLAVVGGQEARPAGHSTPVAASRRAVDPPVAPVAPTAIGGGTLRPKRPRNFGCASCEAYFLSASDRDRHVNTVHHRRRDWPCDQCDFRGLQRAHLKTHVAARHGGERRFVCPHCNDEGGCAAYRSISRSAVERHVRRVHQQLRPFSCTAECGATFAARSDLTRHKLRRHPGAEAGGEKGNGAAAGSTKAPSAG